MFTISNFDEILPQEERHHHPWERFIKSAYADKVKTAHNSINNLRYPEKKEKPSKKPIERLKFTVIGNRVTEEFIYCINLVKGLHKYRKKYFEPPVIRGVTSVDWPVVWNDLKIQYGGLAYCLSSQVVVFLNDKIIGGEKDLNEFIEKNYTYHLSLNYYQESVAQFANFVKGSGRPTVYMHISINDEHIGTMIFMLYSDVVPYTCENFLRLCKATKGGYSGTPVHRIVKDGWIQCGGFGLKGTKLDCENFIVPPDKRGVLCMANAGRHVDCSTQFFVLLQPSPWMLHKYVAFGQLIDGDSTLRKIENVETWYESPTKNITIYKAGILNMDCQDIMINRGANEYIQGHIEDLFELGMALWQDIITRLFLEIQFRENADLESGGEEELTNELHLHPTERFMKKGTAPQTASVQPKSQKTKSQDEPKSTRHVAHADQKAASEHENNDFDVSVYDYEPEEDYTYNKVKQPSSEVSIVKYEKPFYIPLTDVPYPGEVSSEYNLKKFLKGDYCLESDLTTDKPEEQGPCIHKIAILPKQLIDRESSLSFQDSDISLDSDQEAEVKRYLKYNTDCTSFAGSIVQRISKGRGVPSKSDKPTLTDEELRRIRMVQGVYRRAIDDRGKQVSIIVPDEMRASRHIHRRQTGFLRPAMGTNHIYKRSSAGGDRKVHITPELMGSAPPPKIKRRATAFSRTSTFDSDTDVINNRESVLTRLLKEQIHNSSPTLKEFRPQTFLQRSILLTCPTNLSMKSDDRCEHYRDYSSPKASDFASPLKKHGGHTAESQTKQSLRSIQYAKTRPSLTVGEYKLKNKNLSGAAGTFTMK